MYNTMYMLMQKGGLEGKCEKMVRKKVKGEGKKARE